MNLNRVLLSIIAPAMATLFVAAASWSLPHDDGKRHDPQQRITHLAKMLELTDEQEATVQTLLTTSFEEAEADRARLDELKDQLLERPGNFDASTALASADEIGKITGRMVYRMASNFAEIYQLLDDEQRLAMEDLAERRGERGGKRGGHRGFPF